MKTIMNDMKKYISSSSIVVCLFAVGCIPSMPAATTATAAEVTPTIVKVKEHPIVKKAEKLVVDSVQFTREVVGYDCYYISNTFELNGKQVKLRVDCKDVASIKNRIKKAWKALTD